MFIIKTQTVCEYVDYMLFATSFTQFSYREIANVNNRCHFVTFLWTHMHVLVKIWMELSAYLILCWVHIWYFIHLAAYLGGPSKSIHKNLLLHTLLLAKYSVFQPYSNLYNSCLLIDIQSAPMDMLPTMNIQEPCVLIFCFSFLLRDSASDTESNPNAIPSLCDTKP